MRENRASPPFDRIWRLVALFALCGLIYYFSFDNGRQTSKARIARLQEQSQRLEAENDSLRVQLDLLRREAASPRAGREGALPAAAPEPLSGRDASRKPGPASDASGQDGPASDASGQPPASPGLSSQSPRPPSPPGDLPPAGAEEPQGTFIGDAGLSAASAGEGAPPRTPDTAASGEPTLTRLNVRGDESRLLLDGQVLLSVGDIDSLDKIASVRVHQLDTEQRVSTDMQPGESLIIARGGRDHRLLLDQLKGSVAVFILISP
ncbi:MAG: hypothetical protein LBQ12_13360 [Deltaproteobacteria bacterium]|jgi:hypothetical protein|nr:hypothetical protein [Deltaproteobacteria bacterium]